MVYGFTYFTTGILSSCAKLLLKYGAGTRHAGADCIQHRKAWGAFSQMLFTSVKLQGGYGVGHGPRYTVTRADSFLVYHGVRNTLRSMCVCVWGAAIMCVKP